MGTYLEGPVQGKAQYILSEYGGRKTTIEDILCGDSFSKILDEVVICVIENENFDAAAILPPTPIDLIPDNKEFQRWAYDQKPKTWLVVPFKNLPVYIKEVLV